MRDGRLVATILAALVCGGTIAVAQSAPFAFIRDQIPAEAGPVLGLADFDVDGDLDLLTNNSGVYLNDGHGNFTPHPVLSLVKAGYGSSGTGFGDPVGIGDLDGDGDPDVLTWGGDGTPPYFQYLRRWINQGNGVLIGVSTPLLVPSGGFSWGYPVRSIAIGDVDADGDSDVAVSFFIPPSCWVSSTFFPPISLLLNTGGGSFVDGSAQAPAQSTTPPQIALHDVDADGDLDLVCAGDSLSSGFVILGPQVFLNLGGGTFAQTPLTLPVSTTHDCFSLGDVDGDALVDLAFARAPNPFEISAPSPPVLVRNNGGGSFTALPIPGSGTVRAVPVLLDLDASGAADLVLLTHGSATAHPIIGGIVASPFELAVSISPWNLSWGQVSYVARSTSGDVDADGDRDLVVYSAQGNRVVFNDSVGMIVPSRTSLAAPYSAVRGPDVADFDADGNLDLALGASEFAASGPQVRVALNDGTGSLAGGTVIPCSGVPPHVLHGARAFFDADGDGDLDVYVTGNPNPIPPPNSFHQVLLNTGGAYVPGPLLTIPGAVVTNGVRQGDLDGDGDLDLVTAGTTSLALRNLGGGAFQIIATLGPGSVDVAIVDVDGDLDLDIVHPSLTTQLLLNDGSGTFTPAPFPPFSAGTVTAGDFNGDGLPDLVLNGTLVLNGGAGTFFLGAALPGTIPGSTYTAIDADLDGYCDVVDSHGRLFRNAGGAFVPAVTLPSPLTFPIVHADFDRDGDEDLIARGPSILTNMTRQLSGGKPPRLGRPASLEIAGPPGAPWLLFASNGTGNLPLPTLGTVFLDPASVQLTHSGAFSPTGSATVSGVVPPGPSWVGVSVYWQAVVYHPQGPRLTGLEATMIANY